mmetsp:Transcript_12233/g.29672  ORF Transcript_12233/g.29672 Transcript_12233/m.29672 type:complete len:258 (+) Transcript_12233:1188-1961(+)
MVGMVCRIVSAWNAVVSLPPLIPVVLHDISATVSTATSCRNALEMKGVPFDALPPPVAFDVFPEVEVAFVLLLLEAVWLATAALRSCKICCPALEFPLIIAGVFGRQGSSGSGSCRIGKSFKRKFFMRSSPAALLAWACSIGTRVVTKVRSGITFPGMAHFSSFHFPTYCVISARAGSCFTVSIIWRRAVSICALYIFLYLSSRIISSRWKSAEEAYAQGSVAGSGFGRYSLNAFMRLSTMAVRRWTCLASLVLCPE